MQAEISEREGGIADRRRLVLTDEWARHLSMWHLKHFTGSVPVQALSLPGDSCCVWSPPSVSPVDMMLTVPRA